MKFVQLAKTLKEEGVAPIYLIEGEEAYFRDHAVRAIREACALMQPSLNDVRYEGEAVKGEKLSALTAELYTMPFFDAKRIVRIYEFYPTEREWEQHLKGYASSPCETTVLLIVNAGGGKRGVDLKRKSGIVYVDCSKEEPEMLERWLYGVAKRAQVTIDGDAASIMVQYCNLDAARMSLEVKKLAGMLGEGGRITRAVVEEYVAKDVDCKLYELTDAVARGNRSAFSEILHDLMEKGYDENAALAALTSHFRVLSEIAGMRGTDGEIASALGMKPYPVKKNREALARLGAGRAKTLYLELYSLSAGMRSGVYSKSGALSGAVAKIFFG